MNQPNTQVLLFQHLKSILPSHLSMADEVADLLEISPDSAYRRIRGEKPITLEELEKVCVHYNISLDQFLHLKTNSFLFSGILREEKERSFDDWLDHLTKNGYGTLLVNNQNRQSISFTGKADPITK